MLKNCNRKSLYNRIIQFPKEGKSRLYICEVFLVRGTMPANQESVVEVKLTQKLQLPTFRLPSSSKASPPSLRVAYFILHLLGVYLQFYVVIYCTVLHSRLSFSSRSHSSSLHILQ